MDYIYRFVTPQAILIAAREKAVLEKRNNGYRGPVGAIQLDTRETVGAFLEYFDKLGSEGWIYCGQADYPDLPYGGCYVFRKEKKQKQKGITKVTVESIDEQPIDEISTIEDEEIKKDEEVLDMYNEEDEEIEEPEKLMEAPSQLINDLIFNQQKLINKEEDLDNHGDILDELEKAEQIQTETPKKEESVELVRHQLYEIFKVETGKNAVWQGKETKQFSEWLDTKRSQYDPLYKEYIGETGKLPLSKEKETKEFIEWRKMKYEPRPIT